MRINVGIPLASIEGAGRVSSCDWSYRSWIVGTPAGGFRVVVPFNTVSDCKTYCLTSNTSGADRCLAVPFTCWNARLSSVVCWFNFLFLVVECPLAMGRCVRVAFAIFGSVRVKLLAQFNESLADCWPAALIVASGDSVEVIA